MHGRMSILTTNGPTYNRMDKMIRFYVVVSQFSYHYHLDSLIIYVRGCSFTRGRDQNFFAHAEGGTRIFLRMPRGDQKKLATSDHGQTPPLPVKNDSSLSRSNEFEKLAEKIRNIYLQAHSNHLSSM